MSRRMGMLACLVLTALTLWLLPGSLREVLTERGSRVPEPLAPTRTQLLTVWLLSDDTDAGQPLARLLSVFEKQRGDVRVLLRRADLTDLTAEGAVLPDALLFSAYTLSGLEGCLLPLEGALPAREEALCAGRSQLVQRAVPLWFSPGVLAVPTAYLTDGEAPVPSREPDSWLAARATPAAPTPAPEAPDGPGPAHPDRIPWDALLSGGLRIAPPEGMALPQLVLGAPARVRGAVANGLLSAGEVAPSPTPSATATVAAKATPASATRATAAPPPLAREASYRAWRRQPDDTAAYALAPAACDRALLLGLCRDGDAARALLQFLLSPFAQAELAAEGLFSCAPNAVWPADTEAARALSALYGPGFVLANAFAHTRQEALALCRAGLNDPATALLRLR